MKRQIMLILDVETLGDVNKPETIETYDIGYSIVDNKGNIYKTNSFIVSETFLSKDNHSLKVSEKMKSAYYYNKLPLYVKGIKNGTKTIRSFFDIRKEMWADIKEFGINEILAYNANFDRNALTNTLRTLTGNPNLWFFPYGVKVSCIWHMACQTICTMKSYRTFCEKNGFVSKAGNISTSAETVYKFITKNIEFTEEHTGLSDVLIEYQIYLECKKKHKKMNRSINRRCWMIPNKKKK